jgi:hypothetical protein
MRHVVAASVLVDVQVARPQRTITRSIRRLARIPAFFQRTFAAVVSTPLAEEFRSGSDRGAAEVA